MSVHAASPGRQLADGDGEFPPAVHHRRGSPPPRVLSSSQIESFKAEGVLVLRQFVAAEQVESWKAQAWEKLGVDPEDPATWDARNQVSNDDPITPHMGELPQFQALMHQLGGGRFRSGGGSNFLPVFPLGPEAKPWAPAATGHIDGYNTAWRGTGHHRACITLYLNDVEEGQGCFTVWKTGHREIHRYFREHPEMLDGHFYADPAFKEEGWNSLHGVAGGTEFTGKAGDCILCASRCPSRC